MSNATTVVRIAADVLVVCLLVALLSYNYKNARQTSSATSELLNTATNDFLKSDLTTLEGSSLAGSTVVSMVKKYQSRIPVRVATLAGGRKVYTANNIMINSDPSSPNYVRADGSFACTYDTNVNGVITQLRFSERGVVDDVDDVQSIDDAKRLLVDSMNGLTGVDASQTWGDLTRRVRDELSLTSKTQLANTLGGAYLDTDGWSSLSDAATERILGLEAQVNNGNAEHSMQTTACSANAEATLDFMPVYAVVTTTGNNVRYFFYESAWYSDGEIMDNPVFVIHENASGTCVFTNNTAESLSVTVFK